MLCRVCGHENPRAATTCEECHHPIDPGIPETMYCPHCGTLNGAGVVTCRVCSCNLEAVEAIPMTGRTATCPICHAANPPADPGAASYCIACGREIFTNEGADGDEYVPATPPIVPPNVCPVCGVASDSIATAYRWPDSPLAKVLRPPPGRLRYLLTPHRDPDPEDTRLVLDTGSNEEVRDLNDEYTRDIAPADLPLMELWNALNSFAEREIVGLDRTKAEYEVLVELWKTAFYCAHDNLVFIRDGSQCKSWPLADYEKLLTTLEN